MGRHKGSSSELVDPREAGPLNVDVAIGYAELNAAWEDSVRPLRSRAGPLGVLFSAGVDSSLLAWELRHRSEVSLWTMGCEGSPDLSAGRRGAEFLGLPWTGIEVGPNDVRVALHRFSAELQGLPSVATSVLLSLALAIEGASPPLLVCGQGVDELFLGYAHYRGLIGPEAEFRSRNDLDTLRSRDWPRTRAIADRAGKEIVAPYLAASFERAARTVPIDLRLPGDTPKRFFRDWAGSRGLPAELSFRPKKALQYGSGVAALVRKIVGTPP